MPKKCSYTKEYQDPDSGKWKQYKCPHEEYYKGLCGFHLNEYAADKKNEHQLIKLLEHEVEKAEDSGSPLEWIGYQIPPDIDISDLAFDFKVNVYFNYSNFIGNAVFAYCNFERTVSFRDAEFNGSADFSGADFNGSATFYGTHFNREANFIDADFNGSADFSDVYFKEQEKVFFNGDLSKVSFANTEITRVRFRDKVVWGRKKRNSENGDESKEEAANDKNKLAKEEEEEKEEADFKIHDEWLIEKEWETNSLEAVIAEYRNLRENYEYNLRYEEAGQFFIREMELRRKYKQKPSSVFGYKIEKKNIFERIFSFAALYYFVSDYGESTRKPLAITISVFSIATLYFWYLKDGQRIPKVFRILSAEL